MKKRAFNGILNKLDRTTLFAGNAAYTIARGKKISWRSFFTTCFQRGYFFITRFLIKRYYSW